MKYLLRILQGFVMGFAEIVPGINSSTFALIMGIYDELLSFLHSVSEFIKQILKFIVRKSSFAELKKKFFEIDLKFGIFLFLGMIVSVGALSNVMHTLLDKYPQYVFATFFGLGLASISIPYEEMKDRKPVHLLIVIVVGIISFIIFGLQPKPFNENPTYLLLFIGGIFSIAGLILPGVNGSFVLIYFGIYDYIISLVKDFTHLDITTTKVLQVLVFMVGLMSGFLFFISTVKKAFEKNPSTTLAIVIGLMIGSLRILYPFFLIEGENKNYLHPFESNDSYNYLIVIALVIAGVAVIFLLNKLNFVDRNQVEKLDE